MEKTTMDSAMIGPVQNANLDQTWSNLRVRVV